ncbi:MAG TPA: hypothetical protein VHM24_11845 [Gemmatimonadaceae bacterium]|nr:hypothetical protein [Gemmatimonadaceae bacterium]
MRNTKWLIAALLSSAVVSASASAQRVRDFEDSWFWGVKAGVATFSPTLGDIEGAATYGAEWLVTRTHGALYIAVDQTHMTAVSAVFDPNAENEIRSVEVDKLRRLSFAALAFPKQFGRLRPYAGLGLMVNVVGSASPLVTATENNVDDAVFDRIDERRSQAAFLAMAGIQAQFHRTAVFFQASVAPASSSFLLGDSSLGFFEAGVRYNFSGAREGIR